jgi:hypothetical protein
MRLGTYSYDGSDRCGPGSRLSSKFAGETDALAEGDGFGPSALATDGAFATWAFSRLPSGRASILKKGLALHDLPSLKESCLIWWMTVRQGWAPPGRKVLRPVASDLERKAVPHELTEFHQLASAGRAVGSHLDLRPLALGTTRPGSASTAAAREPSLLQM